tara:strand:+ start:37 stop:441 length:405 start_codon:yes stop_codon:yes gene_type:complete
MKNPALSKSVWFGTMVTALGVLEYLESVPEMPRYVLIIIGALIVALRMMTTQPVFGGKKPRKRDGKGRFTTGSCIFLFLISGCSTLSVTADKSADCKFKVTAPHSIQCSTDGKVVFEQKGKMALDIKGCCKCEE